MQTSPLLNHLLNSFSLWQLFNLSFTIGNAFYVRNVSMAVFDQLLRPVCGRFSLSIVINMRQSLLGPLDVSSLAQGSSSWSSIWRLQSSEIHLYFFCFCVSSTVLAQNGSKQCVWDHNNIIAERHLVHWDWEPRPAVWSCHSPVQSS